MGKCVILGRGAQMGYTGCPMISNKQIIIGVQEALSKAFQVVARTKQCRGNKISGGVGRLNC